MIIANPIYDTVFKYLLEDIEIAKGILSALLKVKVLQLELKPQETISEITVNSQPITVYRLDFKALIKTKDGEQKKVLIELQKTKRNADIMRFRRYLAENYQKQDEIVKDGQQVSVPLSIITVYFLGFKLEQIKVPILKVGNCFYDVSKEVELKSKPKEPFVDLLNHESYTIQIPRLPEENQTEIEDILSVFKQKYSKENRQHLDIKEESKNPLTKKIVSRLNRAIADEDLRIKMNLEDEIERTFNREYGELLEELEEKNELLEENRKEIQEKDSLISEKDSLIYEKDSLITEKDSLISEKDSLLEEMRKEIERLKNKD